MDLTELEWLIPRGVTSHQMHKWHTHARERLDLAIKYVNNRNIAIQAGGNLGIWPALLVNEYKFKQVYSFEPDHDRVLDY